MAIFRLHQVLQSLDETLRATESKISYFMKAAEACQLWCVISFNDVSIILS